LKYHRDGKQYDRFADFLRKLLENGQTEMQRKQATHAALFYQNIDLTSSLY
jgi:hypothetical protein